MRCKILLLVFSLFWIPLHAHELMITDLDLPFFNETGLLERSLKAVSAQGPLDRPVLKSGVIEFHTPKGRLITTGSRLTFEEATFDKANGLVEGAGSIRFSTASGDLSGVGFRYELKTGQLKLKSQVLGHFKGVEIHGQRADATIHQNLVDKSWELGEAVISGSVFATDIQLGDVRIDKAETDKATYSGTDSTLTLATPVTTWRKGEKSTLAGKLIQMQLGKDPAPPVPAPAAPAGP